MTATECIALDADAVQRIKRYVMKNLAQYKALFEKELFENVIPFWTKNAIDEVNGGIYNSLDRQGEIYSTDKSVWMQGRAAYMF